ncbi:hypothetical protein EYF80_049177 [Liparis tanakae]|uniref:Uncharacterized protein n=1 Tax=Liparis tanakae TaxID=230148 RepID=A0A4Z2FK48_9TELE|nr:hypothetical protein EYF80_049177 [Liparis tanakae]
MDIEIRERGGLQQDILEGDGNGATGTDANRALGFGGEAQPLQGEDVVAPDGRGQAELASRYAQLMRHSPAAVAVSESKPPAAETDGSGQNIQVIGPRRLFPHLARELGFEASVVGELNNKGLAAAQTRAEVDGFLRRRGQSSEKQVVVEVAQIVAVQRQPGRGLARTQRLVLEAQKALRQVTVVRGFSTCTVAEAVRWTGVASVMVDRTPGGVALKVFLPVGGHGQRSVGDLAGLVLEGFQGHRGLGAPLFSLDDGCDAAALVGGVDHGHALSVGAAHRADKGHHLETRRGTEVQMET